MEKKPPTVAQWAAYVKLVLTCAVAPKPATPAVAAVLGVK